jgi:hypothetical protein
VASIIWILRPWRGVTVDMTIATESFIFAYVQACFSKLRHYVLLTVTANAKLTGALVPLKINGSSLLPFLES